MKDKCISKYTYLKDIRVLSYENEKILIKRKKKYDIEKVYTYLDDHNVNNYLRRFNVTEDNLQEVIAKYKTNRETIAEYNDLDNIKIGTKLIIPTTITETDEG